MVGEEGQPLERHACMRWGHQEMLLSIWEDEFDLVEEVGFDLEDEFWKRGEGLKFHVCMIG